jgi:hypothetical protein
MAFSAWIASVVGYLRDRRRPVAVAAGAVLAILVVAWWSGQPRGASKLPNMAQTGTAARLHPVPEPLAALLEWQSPPPNAKNEGLCGYGPVPIVGDIPQIPEEIHAASQLAGANLADSLAARTTDRERALGLYLRRFAPQSAITALNRAYSDCANTDEACQAAAAEALRNANENRRALIQLATTTSDPDAYALAIFSCPGEPGKPGKSESGDCALLSYAQWARIEPDNAVPWLYLAADAERRRDRSGFEAALYRASQAQYSDLHEDQISGLIASDATVALPPAIQADLAIMLFGIQAAMPRPNLFVLLRYCGMDEQPDSNRVQTCGDLAATLIEDGSPLEVHMGVSVAEQLGWAGPRLEALREQAEAMQWEMLQIQQKAQRWDERQLYSCESLQLFRRNAAARAQLGESGRLRHELAASGLTNSQAAEQWRAEIKRLRQLSEAQRPAQ